MITIEMIDEFRRRTNASYDDARYFLERHNGDMLEAVIEFEKSRSSGYGRCHSKRSGDFSRGFMRVIQRLFDIKITITDKTEKTMNVPVIFPLVLFPFWHVFILLGIVMMILGFRFGIREFRDENYNVESIVSKVKEKVKANRNYQA